MPGIEKYFKLSTTISTNNYVLFDYTNKISRYFSTLDIMNEFFKLREALYQRRKEYILAKLRKEFETIENKVRFILAIINEEIVVNKVKRKTVLAKLKSMGFKTISEINEILPEKKRVTIKSEEQEAEEAKALEEENI